MRSIVSDEDSRRALHLYLGRDLVRRRGFDSALSKKSTRGGVFTQVSHGCPAATGSGTFDGFSWTNFSPFASIVWLVQHL